MHLARDMNVNERPESMVVWIIIHPFNQLDYTTADASYELVIRTENDIKVLNLKINRYLLL